MIYLWWETERENWSWSLLEVKGLSKEYTESENVVVYWQQYFLILNGSHSKSVPEL